MKSIIELAKQANRYASNQTNDSHDWQSIRDERFVALVRAQVLDEAAWVCENTLAQHYMKQVIPDRDEALLLAACADCAAAIRALKEQT